MNFEAGNRVTYFGETTFRNEHKRFGIYRNDRRYHMHLIGRTGTGKSTLMKTMIRQDILNGEGLAVFDPHGDLVNDLKRFVPPARRADLVDFDLTRQTNLPRFNPLAKVPKHRQTATAAGLMATFHHQWKDSWGPRLEHILRNCLLALLDQPSASLEHFPRMLLDKRFRKTACLNVTNRAVYHFWIKESEAYSPRLQTDATAPVMNKIGAFLANPILRAVFGISDPGINLGDIIENRRILLVNLSKGYIGAETAGLAGGLLLARLTDAGMARSTAPQSSRKDFYIYLDEFPTLASDALAEMLSELRKFRINLILAHQFLSQLSDANRDALLGNVGTTDVFRVGMEDAELLEREFGPRITAEDLVNLPALAFFVRMTIHGTPVPAFSAKLLAPENVESQAAQPFPKPRA